MRECGENKMETHKTVNEKLLLEMLLLTEYVMP